ncbi:MAG: hypothetical protein HON65_05815 [Rhodospirillales bacterium]|jgi:DNA-nicking Smr family endonuclease|nr:hypothetical protein [Rhodospirillales bacterium]
MVKREKNIQKGAGIEDDNALWQGVAGSVRPLTRGKNRVFDHDEDLVEQAVAKVPSSKHPPKKKFKTRPSQVEETLQAPSKSHEITHGLAAGVDKRTNMRLIKGQIPPEATLDLHGHTQATAHRALDAFIDAAYETGKRCVRVVTGKGLRLDTGEIGVLRQNVPHWLNSARLRPKILAFSHAPKRDGGEGALYVLLKRKR